MKRNLLIIISSSLLSVAIIFIAKKKLSTEFLEFNDKTFRNIELYDYNPYSIFSDDVPI